MVDREAGITVEILQSSMDDSYAIVCALHGLDCTEERAVEIAEWIGTTLDTHCHEIGLTRIGDATIKRRLDS